MSLIKSRSVTIQMTVTEQCFPLVLFDMLYKVVLTFESMVLIIILYKVVLTIVPVIKSSGVVIQSKASEQYLPAVVFIARCKSSAFDYILVAFGEERCRLGRCLILAWHIGKM